MDPAKKVKIEYSVNPDKIEVSVTDEGNGFNPEDVPDPRSGKNLYKPDGRGLFLMKSYMDAVQFNEQGNCVYMVRHKEKPPLTINPDQDET
jgi:serine/threonine-protein kinase RsbW